MESMPSKASFVAVNAELTDNSSWVYLVDWIMSLLLALGFIFYFNRLLGFALSTILRFTLWHRYKVRVNVESFSIAFVGGRIFIKNLTIITKDYTVSVLKLSFTWRYWLGLTRVASFTYDRDYLWKPRISRHDNKNLPSRYALLLEGLEIFFYNRQGAYEHLMEIINNNGDTSPHSTGMSAEGNFSSNEKLKNRTSGRTSTCESSISDNDNFSKSFSQSSGMSNNKANDSCLDIFFLLRLLPLSIRIKNGTIVIGNSHTPSILAIYYTSAYGIMDIVQSPCIVDKYRIIYSFKFEKFEISLKDNITYKRKNEIDEYNTSDHQKNFTADLRKGQRLLYKFNTAIGRLSGIFRRKVRSANLPEDSPFSEWRGLKRYLTDQLDSLDISEISADEDYAKFSLLLDSESVKISYYYDVPGVTPIQNGKGEKFLDPETGVDLELSGATINYGPWAERRRMPLQSKFFPASCHDSLPSRDHNMPGALRKYGGFKFHVMAKDELILRIPSREPSKHKELIKKYKKSRMEPSDIKLSIPFGWIEFAMRKGTTFTYFASYVPTDKGWQNSLKIRMRSPEMRSSVNHDILFVTDYHKIDCDLTMPLKWNGKCYWKFDNLSKNGRFFMLREHTILLSDIFADFASGVPVPYESLRVFQYTINWKFEGYKFYLNVNDKNIINNPCDFNSNSYISFQGSSLDCKISIPLYGRLRKSTAIDFSIFSPKTKLMLDTPPWHTTNTFMKSSIIGIANDLMIEGSYTYLSQVEVTTSNLNFMRVLGDYVTLKFFGFVVKYLFIIRENYFGDHMHFRTFEEYNNELYENSDSVSLASSHENTHFEYWKWIKTQNDVDTIFIFQIRHGLIVLPYHLFDVSSHIALRFDSFDIDMRLSNVYSDFQADFSPVSARYFSESGIFNEHETIFNINRYDKIFESLTQDLFIDGFSIHSHRMFGLPPKEISYYSKWDFSTGGIRINSDGFFLSAFVTSVKHFIFGFKDVENGLGVSSIIPNAANFTFRCPKVEIKLSPKKTETEKPIFIVQLVNVLLATQELANSRYTTKATVTISQILCEVVQSNNGDKLTLAYLKTSLILHLIEQEPNFEENRMTQQEFIKVNDAPFHRCPFILEQQMRDDEYANAYGSILSSITLVDASRPLNAFTCWQNKTRPATSFTSTESDSFTSSDDADDEGTSTLSDEDRYYQPSYVVDPKFKYVTTICDMGELDIYFTPHALSSYIELSKSFLDLTVASITDHLHFSIVLKLQQFLLAPSIVENIRLVIPTVNVKYSDEPVRNESHVFCSSPKVPLFNLSAWDISFSLSTKYENVNTLMGAYSERTFSLSLREMIFTFTEPSAFSLPLLLKFTDIEIWQDISDSTCNSSCNFENLSFEVDSNQVIYALKFLLATVEVIEPIVRQFKQLSHTLSVYMKEYLYDITEAGQKFHIDHDPGVLTKPAYVLRSQKDHVRYFDSWKILTRIRHIVNNLPSDWIVEENKKFKNLDWKLPSNALSKVLEVFSKWRSWEVQNVENGFIFKYVFDSQQKQDKGNENRRVHLKDILLQVLDGKQNDYILLLGITWVHSLKIGLEVEATDKVDNDLSILDLIVNIDSYESKIGSITFASIESILDWFKSITLTFDFLNKKDFLQVSSPANSTFMFNMNKFSQSIRLPYLLINISGSEIIIVSNVFGTPAQNLNQSVVSSEVAFIDVTVSNNDTKLGLFRCAKLFFNMARPYGKKESHKFVVLNLGKADLHLFDPRVLIFEIIQNVKEKDYKLISNLFVEEDNSSDNVHKPRNVYLDEFFEACESFLFIKLRLEELNYSVNLLSPISFGGKLLKSEVDYLIQDPKTTIKCSLREQKFDLRVSKIPVLNLTSSEIFTTTQLIVTENFDVVSAELSFGYTKIFIPYAIKSIELVELATQKIMSLSQELKEFRKETQDTDDKFELNPLNDKKFFVKLDFKSNYFGISTDIERSKISLEWEGLLSAFSNIPPMMRVSDVGKFSCSLFHGYFSLPSLRFSVFDHTIPTGLSNVLNVDFTIKVLDDSDSEDAAHSLQIESLYFRVCLSPQLICRLINISDKLCLVMNGLNIKGIDKGLSSEKQAGSGYFPQFNLVHVLCYNFCIGWIFGDANKNYPGFILGAERFFAVGERELGKFTLVDAYLSIAKGGRSSDFYNVSSDTHFNSALLPKVQLIYTVEKSKGPKNMLVRVIGDKLDVNLISESVTILRLLTNSIYIVQNSLRMRNALKKQNEKAVGSTKEFDYFNIFKKYFGTVECSIKFAGSNIVIYRISDTQNSSSSPSLLFHSPAVQVATLCKYDKEVKKHIIKAEIMTSSSDNVLYPSSIPVVNDIIEGVKRMASVYRSEEAPAKTAVESDLRDNRFSEILRGFELHIGLRIKKQTLALSCEPTAKVEAIVGIDDIYCHINSMSYERILLSSSLRIESIFASFQHIYSREVSGSINISKILLSSYLSKDNNFAGYTAALISEIDAYVNVKQFQDISLFKDIWFPKKRYYDDKEVANLSKNAESAIEKSELASLRTFSSRFKEISSTSAFPWALTLILPKVNLRADLGKALGNITFEVHKSWAFSRKSSDWKQELELGFHSITLTSEGRLSGTLVALDMLLRFVVIWKFASSPTLDVPLISVSSGISLIHAKLMFDSHVFFMANMNEFSADIYNQKSIQNIAKDHVFGSINLEGIDIFITSLSASTFLDIYNVIDRMLQEARASYRETLHDSYIKEKFDGSSYQRNIFEKTQVDRVIKKVETKMNIIAGHALVHIYPSSFSNSKVLVLDMKQSSANFQENEFSKGISNQLELKLSQMRVLLSKASFKTEEFIAVCSVNEFMTAAESTKGGTIFTFPSFEVSMRTFQNYESNEIEYLYHSSFGGVMDIRWNLGSVNFIRDMWSIHKTALSSRMDLSKKGNTFDTRIKQMNHSNPDISGDAQEPTKKYTYTPLAPPIIQAPQIKELGTATPPLEWFGLHRNQFPDVTHEYVIVNLQRLVHEIDKHYSKFLDRA